MSWAYHRGYIRWFLSWISCSQAVEVELIRQRLWSRAELSIRVKENIHRRRLRRSQNAQRTATATTTTTTATTTMESGEPLESEKKNIIVQFGTESREATNVRNVRIERISKFFISLSLFHSYFFYLLFYLCGWKE